MSEQTSSEEQVSIDSDKAVIEYLEKHPDLLQRYPDLLTHLQVPHSSGRGSVSLIERQVKVLREQNTRLEKQVGDLVDTARHNEQLSEKIHRYSIGLLQARDVEDMLSISVQTLKNLFDVDMVAIHFKPGITVGDDKQQQEQISEKAYSALLDSLGIGRGNCHNDLDDALLQALFGSGAEGIRSCGMAALDTPNRVGILALGSTSKDRFAPGMGTLFLERLGELMSAALINRGIT
jgi:uncharacterized protein YigA (DUF484 family)